MEKGICQNDINVKCLAHDPRVIIKYFPCTCVLSPADAGEYNAKEDA